MNYLEEIRNRFSKDYFATVGAKITIENAEVLDEQNPYAAGAKNVVCHLVLEQVHRNANGGVMGGVFFTLADFVFAIATNGLCTETGCVTLSSTIDFVGFARGKELIGKNRCIKDGKTVCTHEIEITDENENLVAVCIFNGMKKSLKKNA